MRIVRTVLGVLGTTLLSLSCASDPADSLRHLDSLNAEHPPATQVASPSENSAAPISSQTLSNSQNSASAKYFGLYYAATINRDSSDEELTLQAIDLKGSNVFPIAVLLGSDGGIATFRGIHSLTWAEVQGEIVNGISVVDGRAPDFSICLYIKYNERDTISKAVLRQAVEQAQKAMTKAGAAYAQSGQVWLHYYNRLSDGR